VWSVEPGAKDGLDVGVGSDGGDLAGAGIRDVKLIGTKPVGTST